MKTALARQHFANRRVAILGFGREGQSTYRFLRSVLPGMDLLVCDRSDCASLRSHPVGKDPLTRCFFGPDYLGGLAGADLIVRSPGIPFRELSGLAKGVEVTSQSQVFLSFFREQIIGITGTKGKSTTSSLLHHMLHSQGVPALLAGNIGVPPFELIEQVGDQTVIVMEMSSHQLEHLRISPQIAILLNIFEEHLDHYPSYLAYQQAKMNIARWQLPGDHLIFNSENPSLAERLGELYIMGGKIALGRGGVEADGQVYFEGDDLLMRLPGRTEVLHGLAGRRKIPGMHNLLNIAAAAAAAMLSGMDGAGIADGVESFPGLPHRLEHAGSVDGRLFVNDSISTIPESTMAALRSFPNTTSLILGGYDRGVNYEPLLGQLENTALRLLVFTGPAGLRMQKEAGRFPGLKKMKQLLAKDFAEAFFLAATHTGRGEVCLLSPAAASYDAFRDFSERGDRFKELVRQWQGERFCSFKG